MNISPISSNTQNFTGFVKPEKSVIEHFRNVITPISPENRETFIKRVSSMVEEVKNNPIPIVQDMTKNNDNYMLQVRNKNFWNHEGTPTEKILKTMRQAINYAKDQLNIDQNMQEITKIFE
jgi:hypothetical protein